MRTRRNEFLDVKTNAHGGHKAKAGQHQLARHARQGPAERHAFVFNELQFQQSGYERHALPQREVQFNPHLQALIGDQNGDHNGQNPTQECARCTQGVAYCLFLASMDIVAWGTKRRRALGMSFPVTRQMP